MPYCERIKMRYFRDEDGNVISERCLLREFLNLKFFGETDAETFGEYLHNCTDKNGTLTEIRRVDVYDDESETLTITYENL